MKTTVFALVAAAAVVAVSLAACTVEDDDETPGAAGDGNGTAGVGGGEDPGTGGTENPPTKTPCEECVEGKCADEFAACDDDCMAAWGCIKDECYGNDDLDDDEYDECINECLDFDDLANDVELCASAAIDGDCAATCGVPPTPPVTCEGCLETECATEFEACTDTCLEAWNCMAACGSVPENEQEACEAACEGDGFPAEFDNLYGCAFGDGGKCITACSEEE